MSPGYISVRQFARLRGVRHSAVQKAIDSGRVTAVERNAEGRTTGIHEQLATEQWNANTDPVEATRNGKLPAEASPANEITPASDRAGGDASAPAPPPADTAPTGNQQYLEARARREDFEARTAELDYHKAVGNLVSSAEMRESAFRRYRTLRDKLLNIPDRVATILAAERDPVTIHKLITDELKRVLNELSDGARSEAAGGDPERLAA